MCGDWAQSFRETCAGIPAVTSIEALNIINCHQCPLSYSSLQAQNSTYVQTASKKKTSSLNRTRRTIFGQTPFTRQLWMGKRKTLHAETSSAVCFKFGLSSFPLSSVCSKVRAGTSGRACQTGKVLPLDLLEVSGEHNRAQPQNPLLLIPVLLFNLILLFFILKLKSGQQWTELFKKTHSFRRGCPAIDPNNRQASFISPHLDAAMIDWNSLWLWACKSAFSHHCAACQAWV